MKIKINLWSSKAIFGIGSLVVGLFILSDSIFFLPTIILIQGFFISCLLKDDWCVKVKKVVKE